MTVQEPHVNTCYKHFYYFVAEFSLVDKKELEPLVCTQHVVLFTLFKVMNVWLMNSKNTGPQCNVAPSLDFVMHYIKRFAVAQFLRDSILLRDTVGKNFGCYTFTRNKISCIVNYLAPV